MWPILVCNFSVHPNFLHIFMKSGNTDTSYSLLALFPVPPPPPPPVIESLAGVPDPTKQRTTSISNRRILFSTNPMKQCRASSPRTFSSPYPTKQFGSTNPSGTFSCDPTKHCGTNAVIIYFSLDPTKQSGITNAATIIPSSSPDLMKQCSTNPSTTMSSSPDPTKQCSSISSSRDPTKQCKATARFLVFFLFPGYVACPPPPPDQGCVCDVVGAMPALPALQDAAHAVAVMEILRAHLACQCQLQIEEKEQHISWKRKIKTGNLSTATIIRS